MSKNRAPRSAVEMAQQVLREHVQQYGIVGCKFCKTWPCDARTLAGMVLALAGAPTAGKPVKR